MSKANKEAYTRTEGEYEELEREVDKLKNNLQWLSETVGKSKIMLIKELKSYKDRM